MESGELGKATTPNGMLKVENTHLTRGKSWKEPSSSPVTGGSSCLIAYDLHGPSPNLDLTENCPVVLFLKIVEPRPSVSPYPNGTGSTFRPS